MMGTESLMKVLFFWYVKDAIMLRIMVLLVLVVVIKQRKEEAEEELWF